MAKNLHKNVKYVKKIKKLKNVLYCPNSYIRTLPYLNCTSAASGVQTTSSFFKNQFLERARHAKLSSPSSAQCFLNFGQLPLTNFQTTDWRHLQIYLSTPHIIVPAAGKSEFKY